MVQDGGVDEARKLGLAPHHVLGLVANARPDRIDLVEPVRGLELLLRHGSLVAEGGCLAQLGNAVESLKLALPSQ
jgi:hypothetical protein